MGGGGGGPGGAPDAGMGGSGGGGPGGGSPRVPGTGCDPDSLDFRDIGNWRDARRAKAIFDICQQSVGADGRNGVARILPRPPTPNPDGGTNPEEWRIDGVGCTLDGVEDIYSLPTTMDCYNKAW